MKTGLAKQFKQVLDAQARRAREAERIAEGEPDPAAPKRGNRRPAGRDGGPQPPKVNE